MILNYQVWLDQYASQHYPEEYVTGEYVKSKPEFDNYLLAGDDVLLSVLKDAGYEFDKSLDLWVVQFKVVRDDKMLALYKAKEFHPEYGVVLSFVEYLDGYKSKTELKKITIEKQLNKLKNAREDFGKLDGYGAVKISTEEFLNIVDESIEFFGKLI